MQITPFGWIDINEKASQLPAVTERLPFVSYEERFERRGKWLLGPMILAKICRHMRDKALIVVPDQSSRNRVLASLPELPKVRNDLNGQLVSIYWYIPEELRGEFEACCAEVMAYRTNDVALLGERLLPCVNDQTSMHRANAILREYENARVAIGNPKDPPLWECFAERFGVSPFAVSTMAEPFKEDLILCGRRFTRPKSI